MKHLNFFSKRQTCSHNVVTLAATVGSPSAHRRGTMLKHVAFLLLFLFAGFGQMWGAPVNEQVYKQTIFNSTNNSQGISSYSNSWSNTTNSFTINITNANNSNNAWSYIKMGSKNAASTGTLITNAVIDKKVTKVELNIDAITSKNVTSIKLYSSTNKSTWTERGSFDKSTGAKTVTIADATQTANWYYKVEVVCPKSSNGVITISGLKFYYDAGYSITYNCDGADSGCPSNLTGQTKLPNPLPAAPVKDGFDFDGWYTNSAKTTAASAGASLTGNTTLYAKWVASASCANSITITKGTPSHGSFDISGDGDICVDGGNASVTISNIQPESGYRFKQITSSNGGTINNNAKTVTNISANTTINVEFETIPSHKVYFYNGTTLLNTGGTSFQEGAAVSYSGDAPTSCDTGTGASTTFAGWATATWDGKVAKNEIVPDFYEGTLPVMGENDVTYHAVFCKGGNHTVTITNADFTGSDLTNSYTTITITKTIGTTDYDFEINACKQNSMCQLRDNATLSYIEIPELPGVIKSIATTECSNAASPASDYSGTLHFKSSKTRGNSDTDDIAKIALSNASSFNWDLSSNTTHSSGWLFTSAGLRIKDLTITYGTETSNYMTNCCTELDQINGSVTLTPTTATLTWDNLEHVAASNPYAITYRKGSDAFGNTNVGSITTNDQGKKTCTITGLDCGTEYDFKIAVTAASGYCDAEEVLEDKSTTKWNITYTLTNTVNLSEGPEQGANACGEITASFTKNASYTFPETITVTVGDNTLTAENDYLWDNSEGTLVIGADKVTGNVVIAIAGVAPANPIVTPDPTSLSFTQVKQGAAVPAAKDIAITGQNLTAALTVTSSNTDLYVVSVKSGSLTPDANKDASPVITVTPQEGITSTAGDKDATITISGGGLANSVVINVTFNVQETYTVNWYVNGTKIDANSKTDVTGTAVTAPSDFSSFTDCMDKEFMGWATAPIATSQNNAPEGMITNTSEMTISGNADYYAVFATLVSEGGYEKVTNTSVLTAGDKIVITNGGTKAMKAYVSGNNCSAASIELNAAGDKITSLGTEGACEFTLGGTVGAWTFFDGTYYLYDAGSSNNNHMKGKTTKDDACEWVISATSVTSRTNTAKPYMQYNSNSSIFSCYNNSQTNVTLYRKTSAEYSAYVTTCPHITNVALVAESAEHGSISFEKGGSAVTSVRTDGESPVEVDIVKDINDGYEITGLTLTSEDVTGATKNDALTKITIPAGAEGTLTVTPTITLIPKYSIAFAKGDPAVTGSAPSAIADQYAGTPITLPENTYTWADHKFDKWLVIYVDANEQIQEVAVSDNAFTMPAANVTITAQWVEYVTCAVNAYVNGTLNQTEEVQSETTLQLSAFGTPSAPAGVTGYTFAGWALSEESDDVASIEMLGASITPEVGVKSINIYAVFSRTGDEVTDVLTAADLAATNTTYTDFSNVQKLSAAKYAGNSARNSSGDIQMRSSNSNSGIVSTVSAGLVKSVTINVGSGTNTIDLYGSNIAYTAASDLYGNSKGTKIGSTSSTATITPTSEQLFTYVGIRSSNNSIYLSSVSITWQPNYYTTRPAAICDVTYALGGGAWKANEGCADTKVKGGQSYTICSYVPVREGYNFVKWQIGGQDASGEITINANTTITAVWVAKVKSNVTYAAGTGTGDAVVVSNVEEGTEVTIKAIGSSTGQVNFTKGGFDFVGWLYNGNLYKAGTSFEMPASAVTFVAQWKKQNITKMTLVTDVAQLVDGSKVVIAQAEITDDACKTMGAQGSNNRSAVASTVDGNVISVGEGTSEFTLVSLGNNLFAFQASNGNYLYAASSSNNYLREQATIDGNASWTISIASNGVATIKAQGANSHNWMQYNSGNTLFSCYENAQKDIAIYASVTSVTENANISDLGYVEGETVVASGTGVVLTIDEPTPTTSITASNGATVVVNTADAQAENITVEDGGTVEVAQDVTVETLVISTSLGSISGEDNTGGKSGQVTGSGSINATGDVFIQIELTQDEKASAGWYAFSLPFKVDALNGVYFGDKKLQNEKDYAIMAWHGEIRATGEYGWKKYREVMDPGVLYIITVGNTDYKTLRFKKVAGEAIVQAEDDLTISAFVASGEGQQATDAGWNGIGNKSLQIMQQRSYATMQFLDHTDNAFKARTKNDVNILVGSAFFVQYGSTTTVLMEASTSGSIALAPAREQESIEKTVFEAKLKNAETGKTEDNLFFTAREDALNEYEAGRDVTKMSMGEAKCAQMFIPAYGTKLCAADFPLVNNQATYPLTLTIPTTGTYSISIKENENANIYLTKNGAIIWNLTKSPYTIEMEEGTTEGYGLILVKRMPQDVETVSGEASEAGVQKVVINDKVFILRGEKMYDVTGKAVR